MQLRLRSRLLRLASAVVFGLLGCLVAGVAIYVRAGRAKPDLEPWHTLALDEEFRAAQDAGLDFAGYLALEERLYNELEQRLAQAVDLGALQSWSRFRRPVPDAKGERDWNRTYELAPPDAKRGALLLHGTSDSPFSLRALALALEARGVHVVGMRYPGHGTIPSGLTSVRWEDLAAVARIGARHLREVLGPDAPIAIVGYSTGAALAVEYCASRMLGEELPAVDRLVLISPAIGVSGVAALAIWQARASGLPGLHKLAWLDVLPEYDRYKYNSFPVDGGDLVYRLTLRIQAELAQLAERTGAAAPIPGFPPTLAMCSAVDATVHQPATVDDFLARLAPEGHALVVFDIDRSSFTNGLVRAGEGLLATRIEATPALPFELTVVANESPTSHAVVARTRAAGASEIATRALSVEWPRGVYSLSHVALPFPPDDPQYGIAPGGDPNARSLGKLEARGERGLLVVPSADLQRLRYNPFWEYLEERALAFLEL